MKTALTALEDLGPDGQARALDWLASSLEVDMGQARAKGSSDGSNDGGSAGHKTPEVAKDIDDPKAFLANKSPESDAERVTCLAYFLAKNRKQDSFTTKDLMTLNTEAAGRKISNPGQATADAVRYRSYLAPAGSGKRQITRFGEELVEALPDRAAVKAVTDKIPKKKRRKAKAKKAKS